MQNNSAGEKARRRRQSSLRRRRKSRKTRTFLLFAFVRPSVSSPRRLSARAAFSAQKNCAQRQSLGFKVFFCHSPRSLLIHYRTPRTVCRIGSSQTVLRGLRTPRALCETALLPEELRHRHCRPLTREQPSLIPSATPRLLLIVSSSIAGLTRGSPGFLSGWSFFASEI